MGEQVGSVGRASLRLCLDRSEAAGERARIFLTVRPEGPGAPEVDLPAHASVDPSGLGCGVDATISLDSATMKRTALRRSSLVLVILAAASCGPAAPPEPVVERVENPDLGVAIAALPEPFTVTKATGESIELTAAGPGGDGRLLIAAGAPRDRGINLLQAVEERKAAFEAAPGGRYFGNRTLGGSLGNVFTARGSYESGGVVVEETWAFALHPLEKNRMLTITYTYPTGESEVRVKQLLDLLGEIEGQALPDAATP